MDFKGRTFLMLQGPQSKFFPKLARELIYRNAKVVKINLCGGDVLLWGKTPSNCKAFAYHGRACDWPQYITKIYDEYKVTDVCVYGDWRSLHQDAILIAKDRSIKVWVFEEGYLRAGFSTLEEGGVNGRSLMPKQIENVISEAKKLPAFVEGRVYKDSIFEKVHFAILHHVGNVILYPLFLFYRTHRPHNIFVELFGILPRYLMRHKRRKRSAKVIFNLFASKKSFYFYPLQLGSDSQIQLYSPYIRQEEAITTVIASFARNAPKDSLLVIKNHPLDNGLIPYYRFIKAMSKALRCQDRVLFVDDGNTNVLIAKSKAVVLVNSTVGLSALLKGKPVFCLGISIYALKGLANSIKKHKLDEFWNNCKKPDPIAMEAFCRVLKERTLIPGNFYCKDGLKDALLGTLERFCAKSSVKEHDI